MSSIHQDRAREYWERVTAAANELDERLANVRNDVENHEISIAEAAQERVELLERHLDMLRELREQYLDPPA